MLTTTRESIPGTGLGAESHHSRRRARIEPWESTMPLFQGNIRITEVNELLRWDIADCAACSGL